MMIMISFFPSSDDPLVIFWLFVTESRRSTFGVSAEDSLVERAQRIHWWITISDSNHIGHGDSVKIKMYMLLQFQKDTGLNVMVGRYDYENVL